MNRVARTKTKPIIIKQCPCGREFTQAQWNRLRLFSRTYDKIEMAELRNCPSCKSTLYVGTVLARILYRVERCPGGLLVFRRAGSQEVMLREGDVGAIHTNRRSVRTTIANERQLDLEAGRRLAIVVDVTTKGGR